MVDMDEFSEPEPGLAETHRLIGQALRRLLRVAPEVHTVLAQRVGVGTTDLMALDRLTAGDQPMGVVELGDSLGIRSASATVLVDRLVAAGHLQRQAHPTDGRRRVVETTESARGEMLEALLPLLSGIREVTDRLDADTSRSVLVYLLDVCGVLEGFAAPQESVQHRRPGHRWATGPPSGAPRPAAEPSSGDAG